MYPKLEQHCPFKDQLAEAMDGDLCRICNHVVHDLDAMEPEARRAFLKGSGQACVRYRIPAALAAAALAASAATLPAAAQQANAPEPAPPAQEWEDDQAIVGVMVRLPDPCERVDAVVEARSESVERGCQAVRAASRPVKSPRTKARQRAPGS